MRKNPGRKERRKLARDNRRAFGKQNAKINERLMKKAAHKKNKEGK